MMRKLALFAILGFALSNVIVENNKTYDNIDGILKSSADRRDAVIYSEEEKAEILRKLKKDGILKSISRGKSRKQISIKRRIRNKSRRSFRRKPLKYALKILACQTYCKKKGLKGIKYSICVAKCS